MAGAGVVLTSPRNGLQSILSEAWYPGIVSATLGLYGRKVGIVWDTPTGVGTLALTPSGAPGGFVLATKTSGAPTLGMTGPTSLLYEDLGGSDFECLYWAEVYAGNGVAAGNLVSILFGEGHKSGFDCQINGSGSGGEIPGSDGSFPAIGFGATMQYPVGLHLIDFLWTAKTQTLSMYIDNVPIAPPVVSAVAGGAPDATNATSFLACGGGIGPVFLFNGANLTPEQRTLMYNPSFGYEQFD